MSMENTLKTWNVVDLTRSVVVLTVTARTERAAKLAATRIRYFNWNLYGVFQVN